MNLYLITTTCKQRTGPSSGPAADNAKIISTGSWKLLKWGKPPMARSWFKIYTRLWPYLPVQRPSPVAPAHVLCNTGVWWRVPPSAWHYQPPPATDQRTDQPGNTARKVENRTVGLTSSQQLRAILYSEPPTTRNKTYRSQRVVQDSSTNIQYACTWCIIQREFQGKMQRERMPITRKQQHLEWREYIYTACYVMSGWRSGWLAVPLHLHYQPCQQARLHQHRPPYAQEQWGVTCTLSWTPNLH